jgi:hypothetical protein
MNETEPAPFRQAFQKATAMINRLITPRTLLDKAIVFSFAAMLAMNVFVLTQQLDAAPAVAQTDAAATAQQA